jgi:hypothetical protein
MFVNPSISQDPTATTYVLVDVGNGALHYLQPVPMDVLPPSYLYPTSPPPVTMPSPLGYPAQPGPQFLYPAATPFAAPPPPPATIPQSFYSMPIQVAPPTPLPVPQTRPPPQRVIAKRSSPEYTPEDNHGSHRGAPGRHQPFFFSPARQKRSSRPVDIPPPAPGETEPRQLTVNFVSGLVTDEVLVELFGGFPGFEAGRVVTDHLGRSRGVCHLWFTSADDAFAAVNEANGRVLLGKRLRVTFTVPQQTLANFNATL